MLRVAAYAMPCTVLCMVLVCGTDQPMLLQERWGGDVKESVPKIHHRVPLLSTSLRVGRYAVHGTAESVSCYGMSGTELA
eukprot:1644509-Rhodomonas_salina.3